MICLDTNAVIAVLDRSSSRVDARLRRALLNRDALAISVVVLVELWHGALKSVRTEANIRRIEDFLAAPIEVLSFENDDAREAGNIRAALERAGTPIGPYDILVAAQARRRAATLVTANAREFACVPGLKTVDWAA
jgi:tRNA(fMet)-specific endonuclease VapC